MLQNSLHQVHMHFNIKRVEKVVLRRKKAKMGNEQVYMHFNIKRVEKVVLRRKKAKVGKTHCFTCFKMRLHLR